MTAAASTDKPNILIVVVDSMRADHVSAYGYHRPTTPNFDLLAEQGCLFETAISAAPFSPASYASLFSNLYPHQHGVNGDTVRVWPDHFTRLAEKLQAAGYYTFGISNNDFVSRACNSVQGFDEYIDVWDPGWRVRQHQRAIRGARKFLGNGAARWLETNGVQCAAKGDSEKSLAWTYQCIIEAGRGRPFFGFIVLMDPHAPLNRRHTRFLEHNGAVTRFFREFNEGQMWVKRMALGEPPSDEQMQIAMDAYDSEIHHADICVGRLCHWLGERGLLDDTVVAVTADHGEAFGEQGVWGHGFTLNDCLTRVPLVMRCPRYWPAGTRSPALVQLHDLHDLCLSLAETGEPQTDKHPNCLTQARDPEWQGRDVAFSEFPIQSQTLQLLRKLNPQLQPGAWEKPMWSARTRQWRYTEYEPDQAELFDLSDAAGETQSVLDQQPDVAAGLRARLEQHRQDRPAAPSTEGEAEQVDEKVLDRLRALGYID